MKNILLVFCIYFVLACGCALAQAPTVYLPLNDNLLDASGNNLHATDAGSESTSFESDPQRGMVARFGIGAHAQLPLDPKLDFGTQDFSVAFWVKIADGVIPSSDPVIIGNKDWGSGGNTGFLVALDGANEVGSHMWTVNAADGLGGRLDWDADDNATPNLVDGSWHFIAVVFDRDATMNVYLDGVLRQTDVAADSKELSLVPGDLAPDNLPFTIMQDATGAYAADFEGFLDDILIYNRVLSQEEITTVNENGFTVDPALGATVYLPFDGDLLDASGNALNGTDAGTEATTFVEDSQRGTVASFPVAAHVTLPVDPKLDFGTEDFTVSFWVKVDDSVIPTSDPVIIGNKDWNSGGNTGFLVALDGADAVGSHLWTVNAANAGGGRLDWDADDNGTPNLVDGAWHFVAVAFDRDATMNVYLDGVLRQTDIAQDSKDLTLAPGDLAPDNLPFTIMQDATGSYSADFAGFLDDVRVWKGKALSEEEINTVFNFTEAEPAIDASYGADVYLPFDSDLNDATGNNVHAEDKGTAATTFVEDPERGLVASFQQDAYAQFPLAPELDFGTGDFSFAFWIKISDATSIAGDPVIFGNKDWDSGGNVGYLVALDDADSPDAHMWTVNTADGTGRLDWDADDNGTPNLKDGNWHFVAVAFDRDAKLNVYLDGLLRQSDPAQDSYDLTMSPGNLTSGLPLTIMQDATGLYPNDFAALMDDLRIWKDKVLSSGEVASMFNPLDKPYEATVFLPLNNNLSDFSGNGLHAADAGSETVLFTKDPERGDVALFPVPAHAQLPMTPELEFGTNDLSVAFWIKINPLIPIAGDPVIMGNKDWNSGSNPGFLVGLDDPDGGDAHKWTVNVADGTGRLDWDADDNQTPTLKDGNWHFVAVAFDRDQKLNVYFDGALKQTDVAQDSYDLTLAPGSLTTGLPFTIMQDATGAYGNDFSSLLDNVRIWNRVITAAEVADMFANDKGSGIGGEEEIIVGIDSFEKNLSEFSLYPNPANGASVNLSYNLPAPSEMRLTLVNSLGTVLRSWMYEEAAPQGVITMESSYEPGLYFLHVEANNFRQTLKLMILK